LQPIGQRSLDKTLTRGEMTGDDGRTEAAVHLVEDPTGAPDGQGVREFFLSGWPRVGARVRSGARRVLT
jgi:hypothetical protein